MSLGVRNVSIGFPKRPPLEGEENPEINDTNKKRKFDLIGDERLTNDNNITPDYIKSTLKKIHNLQLKKNSIKLDKSDKNRFKKSDNISLEILNLRKNILLFKIENGTCSQSDIDSYLLLKENYFPKFPSDYFNCEGEDKNKFLELFFNELEFYSIGYELSQNKNFKDNLKIEGIKCIYNLKKLFDTWPKNSRLKINARLLKYAKQFELTKFKGCYKTKFGFLGTDNEITPQVSKAQALSGLKNLTKVNSLLLRNYGIKLRPYQKDALVKLQNAIEHNNFSTYCVLPTGSGKSIIMIMALLAMKIPAVIIVPTINLLNQIAQTIENIDPSLPVGMFNSYSKKIVNNGILLTTYASMSSDLEKSNDLRQIPWHLFGVIVADEAHHLVSEVRSSLFEKLKLNSIVIGFTATDKFAFSKGVTVGKYTTYQRKYSKLHKIFGHKHIEITRERLIHEGYLNSFKQIMVTPKVSEFPRVLKSKFEEFKRILEKGEAKTLDYSELELQLINQKNLNEDVANIYFKEKDPYTQEFIFGKQTLVFSVGIEHAKNLATIFNKHEKIQEKLIEFKSIGKLSQVHKIAEAVHSELSVKQREIILDDFKNGKILILVGDNIFCEGFDYDKLEVAFMVRPTKSSVLSTQRAGRTLRSAEGKKPSLIFEWDYFHSLQEFFIPPSQPRWIGIDDDDLPLLRANQAISNEKNYKIDWRPQLPGAIQFHSIESSETKSDTGLQFNFEDASIYSLVPLPV